MKRFLLICFFPFFLFAQNESAAVLSTKKIVLSPFENLKVFSGIDIELVRSDGDSLLIESEAPDEVVSVVKGNVLKLRLGLEHLLQKSKTLIKVYHSHPIDHIELNQGAQLHTQSTIKQTSLSLFLQEGAQAKIAVELEKLAVKVQSGAKFFPTGSAKNLIIQTTSGGACEADQLIAEQAEVKASLGGIVYVNATELVDAKSSINATIRVHGKPVKLISKESVGGKVVEMQ